MRADELAKRFNMEVHVEGGSFLELDEEDILIPFSAEKGDGKAELLAAIAKICGK